MGFVLGLDVGTESVRAVVLKTALRNSQVVRYLEEPLNYGSDASDAEARQQDQNDAGEDRDPLRLAVRRIFANVDPPPDRIITAMSGAEVSVRKLSVPDKAAKKLNELLPFELEGKVPFDPDVSIIDHQPIETRDGELYLLAAITPRKKVWAHLQLMEAIGVQPRAVGVGAVALDGLVPLLPELTAPGPHFLFEIHERGTDVCIVVDGVCHFARTLSVDAADLDAGNAHLLERDIRQTLAVWRMEGGSAPARFVACGAMATRPGIAEWLSGKVGAPVEVVDLPSAPGADPANVPAFARAAALAGRALSRRKHLDARQGQFAATQAANALRQHLGLVATSAAVIVAAFAFSAYARYSVLDTRHEQLQAELAETTEDVFGEPAYSSEQALRMLSRGARGRDPMPSFDAYDALSAISATIPVEITHDVRQLQIDLGDGEENGRFSLRGTVNSVSDTEAIVSALNDHRLVVEEGNSETRMVCFRSLELGNTTATGDDRRSYRLEGEIRCRPEGEADEDEDDQRSNRRRRRRRGGRG